MLASFEAGLDQAAKRAGESRVLGIIPYQYFSGASSECREMFIHGHFYGCISLAQAVAQALARLAARKNGVRVTKDLPTLVRRLLDASLVSDKTAEALIEIWGEDRNRFHHLNEDVELSHSALQTRAAECVEGLHTVESELFAYEIVGAKLWAQKPAYWPRQGPNAQVFLRFPTLDAV